MRNLTATTCLAVALLLGSAGVSWSQDFQKGSAAAKSGDYAAALPSLAPTQPCVERNSKSVMPVVKQFKKRGGSLPPFFCIFEQNP